MDSFPNSTTAISSSQEKVSEVMRIVCPVIAFLVLILLILNYTIKRCLLNSSNFDHETSMISDRELHDFVHVTIIDRPETMMQNTPCYPQKVLNLNKVIPGLTYSSSLSLANGSSNCDENCSICLCELSNGETVRVLPKCKHIFHKECIDEWLPFRSLNCPICRVPVIEVDNHERRGGANRTNRDNSSHERRRGANRTNRDSASPSHSSSININPYGWSMSFTSGMLNLDRWIYPNTPTIM
ncbi:RING-H2 finger protein ATL77-like [Papaver somniferum]|nr:RING-H2 finger protein ATL77-like [Papaver somniferum]